MPRILLDLNNPAFLDSWLALEREDGLAVLATLRKMHQMDWQQLYRDRGLRWEAILSRSGPGGERIYSLRVTKRVRAVGYRHRDFLRILSIHSDHDSTYE